MRTHPFDLLMELDSDQIRLDCAALHLARDAHRHLVLPACLYQLDVLADAVGELRPGLAANLRYDALRAVLVDQHNLTGDDDDYYSPDNFYLNRILDQRRGSPVGLSIVWIEVARRLKWPLYGVALPGHFICRIDDPERFVLIDPFQGGRALSVDECEQIVIDGFDGKIDFHPRMLDPVDTRAVLSRLLSNLRNIYLMQNDMPRVGNVLRRMAALEPENGRHLRDLAAVCCRRGDVRGACAHLELYLQQQPAAQDSQIVRSNLKRLHAALLALN
jgi:regulator of sirC expression with transglutaminase-like and TPR domain